MIKKILVPLDGSQNAEQALRIVDDLALWKRIELVLLRVVENGIVPIPSYKGSLTTHTHVTAGSNASQSSRYIKEMADRERAIIREVTEIVEDGDPAAVIIQTAEREEIDLIVMASPKHNLFERMLFGSVTERVVRTADCPVLVLRDGHLPDHILVALDGTSYSESVLPLVFELAFNFDSEVTLATVRLPKDVPSLEEMGELARVDRVLATDLVALETNQLVEYLEGLCQKYTELYDVETHIDIDVGRPGPGIAKLAARRGCDLIAMVTHGRTGLDWLAHGSVTQQVMHRADTAMLILHKDEL